MIRKVSKYPYNYSFLFWFILLTINFLIFNILNSSASTQVALEWNPNSEPNLAGYKIFSREIDQSYDYENPSWEGTDTHCIIYDLDETKTYCFVARAFNSNGVESGDSNEVCLEAAIVPDIKANGSNEPISIVEGDPLSVIIEFDPGNYQGVQADWWCVLDAPLGWYYYDGITKEWLPGFRVFYQGPLEEIFPALEVLNTSDFSSGSYTFFFIIDRNRNGNLDQASYYDSVDVNIMSP